VNGSSAIGESKNRFQKRIKAYFRKEVSDKVALLSICDGDGERPFQLADMARFPRYD
jgi:hypothetical protein